MTDPTTLLDLGGITTEPTDTSVPLLATTWTHPGLPGRTIVRLTAEPLARAEELSLEVTGFAPGPRTPVGHTRRRAIGFPAWPIIHDPANAHHALNIVADLERMARTARSKPGFAKDQVDAMVSTLDATAPHYLPTLLEEAGRIFGRLDNTTYATQMFSKAREAERRHNLTIDPERHREVFLEFAYAGALPVKELTAEAARLADHPDPARAYADFRTLCVERTRGGLAPYANMAKDLRKLARAAGLDQVAEDRALVADLLAAPVIGKAGPHFWKAYDKAIGQLAGSDPAARERLLTLTPEAFGVEEWLERLERWGATDHVVADTDLAFFHRMVDWLQTFGGWRTEVQPAPRLEAFAASLAPALIAAGEPLTFREARLWAVPADLLDRFAELGLPLTIDGDPGFYCRIELSDWAQQDQRRDLTHLAGVAALRAPLEAGFERAYAEHGAELARAAGTRPLVLAKLAKAAEATATRPVTLMTLTTAWKVLVEPVAAVDDPEIRTTIRRIHAQVDAGEVLADNLRLGTLAELAWPAAEAAYAEAVAALPPQPHSLFSRGPQLALSWPDLVIEGAHAALVCGETRRTFVAPVPNATIEDVVSVGADTALRWREESTWNLVWAWDRDPARTFEASRDYVAWDERVALNASLVTEHGRLFAAGLMRPGEDGWKSAQTGNVLHDGRDYWAATATQVVELDPASGQPGRASLPDWFAEIAARHPGHTLRPGACQLHLVTPDTAGSLVSTADGFHRSALLESGDEVLVVAADGATYPLDPDEVTTSTALVVERPGGGTWLLAGGNNDLIDPETGQTLFPPPEDVAVLHPKQLPVLAFHHARVRDEAASTWLRQATVEEANAIVDAVADAINATPEAADDEETLARYAAASTAAVRPWVADDALAAAVAWMTSTVIGVTDLL